MFLNRDGSRNSLINLGLKTSIQYPVRVFPVDSFTISTSNFCFSNLTLNDLLSYPSLKDLTQEKVEELETKVVKGRISYKSLGL